jgi:hypothetical protein
MVPWLFDLAGASCREPIGLTNTIAICLGVLIVAGLIADAIWADWANLVFLFKKFTAFTEWMAFWR